MKHYAHLVLLLGVPLALSSCALQPIDTEASKGSAPVILPIEPGNVQDPGDGTIPILTETPVIQIFTDPGEGPKGDTTTSACVQTSQQATMFLNKYCAACHALGDKSEGVPTFKDVLDLSALTDPMNQTDIPGVPFVMPGYPEKSRIYQRVSEATMPKIGVRPEVPARPSVSEISVLEEWIANCLGVERPHG